MGTGFTDKNVGHLGFDQTRLEIWEYKDGKFIKISEKSVPISCGAKSGKSIISDSTENLL